jgi:hypothetical protein
LKISSCSWPLYFESERLRRREDFVMLSLGFVNVKAVVAEKADAIGGDFGRSFSGEESQNAACRCIRIAQCKSEVIAVQVNKVGGPRGTSAQGGETANGSNGCPAGTFGQMSTRIS